MRYCKTFLALVPAGLLFAAEILPDRQPTPVPNQLIAHEWGTFTSVAARAGNQVRWAPFSGSPDLPCFVSRLGPVRFKYFAGGSIRMETPVIYFYSRKPATLSVHVGFPHGWITEWYPKATKVWPTLDAIATPVPLTEGEIGWAQVKVQPGPDPAYPTTTGGSHYYAARNTDASPIQVEDQHEKLIFYRGIGNFLVPLRPKFTDDGNVVIASAIDEPIGFAMLFENHGGKIGYRIVRNIRENTQIAPPELTAEAAEVHKELAGALTEAGLYRREALAMVETWKDSWFEEGTRVFYLAPRSLVDAELPLQIKPAPTEVARVFVGRVEMLSPWMESEIKSSLERGDVPGLARFGRFLEPFLQQMSLRGAGLNRSPAAQQYLKLANEASNPNSTASCVK